MKKLIVFVLALCLAVPLIAQDYDKKDGAAADMDDMEMPKALEDDFFSWLVGEWEGWSEGPKGKSEEWEKFHMGLNGQFLLSKAKSVGHGMVYKGMGGMTTNLEGTKVTGYWMDSLRGMYHGEGKREGNTLMMKWNGAQGTYEATTVKAADDKYTLTWAFTDPDGNRVEGKKEMTRVSKMMTDQGPPEPLSADVNWIVGEWQGWSEGPMGKAKTWQKIDLGLDGQFHLVEYKSVMDNGMTYKGLGAITLDHRGHVVGYWIDNMRTMSEGKGHHDGDTVTMEWQNNMGNKMTRIMTKVSNDKFTVVMKIPGPDGTMMESKEEMTRVKTSTNKY